MVPYRRDGEIDYSSLDFCPDLSIIKPDAMLERREQMDLIGLLAAHFTDFNRRPDVFVDRDSNICYDRNNLNVRVSPDVYLAFGVDTKAIRRRNLYLPWEAGKPPDWVLEFVTESTWKVDLCLKPVIYAQIGGLPSIGALYPLYANTAAIRWLASVWSAAFTSPLN